MRAKEENAHSALAPSSASRWTKCPASVALTLSLEEEGLLSTSSSAAAEEGTQAHAVAEYALQQLKARGNGGIRDPVYAYLLDEGYDIEMLTHVMSYVEYIDSLLNDDDDLLIETRLELAYKFCGEKQFGSADAILYSAPLRHLHAVDFKYGRYPVDASNNLQLLAYGEAARLLYKSKGLEVEQLTLHIVQPRINNTSAWNMSAGQCEHAAKISLVIPARKASRVNKKRLEKGVDNLKSKHFRPAESTCKFCPALAACRIKEKEVIEAVGFNNMRGDFIVHSGVEDKTYDSLIQTLRAAGGIKDYLKAAEDYALKLLSSGVDLGPLSLGETRTTRHWKDVDALLSDDALSGLDLALEVKRRAIPVADALLLCDGDKSKSKLLTKHISIRGGNPMILT